MQSTKTAQNLLDARGESLKNAQHGVLRPHGKLWGMDVFSWANPDIEAFTSTVHAFPFPLIWVAPSEVLQMAIEHDSSISLNLHAIICFEDVQSIFKKESFEGVGTIISVNNAQEAFNQLNTFKLKNGIVLFCSYGADFESQEKAFKEFLQIHQI